MSERMMHMCYLISLNQSPAGLAVMALLSHFVARNGINDLRCLRFAFVTVRGNCSWVIA
jgi:hypothetical protein